MSHTATRSAGILVVATLAELFPSNFFFDQCLQHLSYFMIIVHVIVLVKAFHKLVHALALGTIDQEK